MKHVSLYVRRSPRVYYRLFCAMLFLLQVLAVGPARAQLELTAPPSMIKGPPGAPVTIVEFSDYQ